MENRLRICLWMLGGGVFGGVLGGAFGALTAALYERSGGAAGTRLARNIVENFLQSGDRQPSPTFHAALIGAVDGFLFMGSLGLVAGTLLGVSGRTVEELLVPIVVGCVCMAGGAIFFGAVAFALTYRAAEFLYYVAGSILGSFVATSLLGSGYGPVGLVPGMILGHVLCRALRRYAPKFQPPHIGKTMPQPRSDADTDITSSQPSPANDDCIRKLG